jgi:hypothetical protein
MRIKTTHIDTGSHGYLSVSKKDLSKIYTEEQIQGITGYSGHNLTRVYLEEDKDATDFLRVCEEQSIQVDVKEGYNPNFKTKHNFDSNLYHFSANVGDKFIGHYDILYKVVESGRRIKIENEQGRTYKLPKSNPYDYVVKIVPTD